MVRLAAMVALAVAAIRPLPAFGAAFRTGGVVMGTVLNVTVIAGDAAAAERLAGGAMTVAKRWDDVLTTWRPDGELARVNERAGAVPVRVSADLESALRRMLRLTLDTGGAFDPAVGPLVALWRQATPPARQVAAGGSVAGAEALTLSDGYVRLSPGTALDAGGIGKGIALDEIAGTLREGGAEAAFLDFGGSSQLAFGAPPDDPQGWSVAVGGYAPGTLRGVVRLRDASLSTSRATGPGAEAGPIIDPRSRRPVEARRVASVLARDATTADAWSTALVVLGRDGLARARALGVEVFVEDDAGAIATAEFWRPSRFGTPPREAQ